jgi:thiamine biosynthesis lipoprotein
MQHFTHSFRAMGGPCELQLNVERGPDAQEAFHLAEAEVRRIESKYSRYRPDSLLSRINAAAGRGWVECDDESLYLLAMADTLNAQTNGLFDATSGVLRRAWTFDGSAPAPGPQDLAPLLTLVGWHLVQRRDSAVYLTLPGMELDFGGFGKEYAADRVAALWQKAGVRHGLVNLAGDIRVFGHRTTGGPWQLGIQHPRKAGALLAQLPLSEGALVTSGDYERYFIDKHGRRHCHVLNPRTGHSAYHWQSISVVAPLAVLGGGISTAAMLMDVSALDWLRGLSVDFLAVDAEGRVHSSNASGEP